MWGAHVSPFHRKHLVCALVTLLLLVASAVPSNASNFTGASGLYGCSAGNMGDNATHSFWYEALTPATVTALNWTRTNSYNPTDVNTVNEDLKDPLTDVIANDADYEGVTCGQTWISSISDVGLLGYALCTALSGTKCQQFQLYFDNDFMGPATASQEATLACHEVGHSLGLMHTNTGANCMQSPGVGSPGLTTHDISHLNANY